MIERIKIVILREVRSFRATPNINVSIKNIVPPGL